MFFANLSDMISYEAALSANLECSAEIIEQDEMTPGFSARITVSLGGGPQAHTVLSFTPDAEITDHMAMHARFEEQLQDVLPAFGGNAVQLEACRSHLINVCFDAFTDHLAHLELN